MGMMTMQKSLDKRLSALEKDVQQIRRALPEVIIIEQMTKEQIRKKLLDYIKKHKTTNIIELHSAIKCDIKLLINAIDELIKEGRIGA